MTGRKTLKEVKAELEAAFAAGPPGNSEVAESLRRLLAGSRRPLKPAKRHEAKRVKSKA